MSAGFDGGLVWLFIPGRPHLRLPRSLSRIDDPQTLACTSAIALIPHLPHNSVIPPPLLPCDGGVQAPTCNPSCPIGNLRNTHVILQQSFVSAVQVSREYASSQLTARLTLCTFAQRNPPRILTSKPSCTTPRSSRRRSTSMC
jgi:hypothetical protein